MRQNRGLPLLLISVLALIWGSSFILMKRGLEIYPPDQVGGLRMMIAGLCMTPCLFFIKEDRKNIRWLPVLLVGILGNGIPAFLFARAQTGLSSSTTGVLNSLTPLFALLVGVIFFKISVSWLKLLGILMGLAGAVCLILLRTGGKVEFDLCFGGFVVIATICYAFSVNIIKSRLQGMKALSIASIALCFAGIPSGIYVFAATDFTQRIHTEGALLSLFYIFILAAIGTSLSIYLFNILIQYTSAVTASSVTYLIPVVALLWGILDGEDVGLPHLIGMAMILAGVYLVNKKIEN